MKNISVDELKKMAGKEGLILQGCGGDPQEWFDGINDLLTEENILLDGDKFKDISVFQNGGVPNILFDMDNVKLDVGKLAMWRLSTHDTFGGTWLSDYLPNKLGVDPESPAVQQEKELPDCPIIGADGNVFNLMAIASRTLKQSDMKDEAKEMCERVQKSGSYDEALSIMMEYVNPVGEGDMSNDFGMGGM